MRRVNERKTEYVIEKGSNVKFTIKNYNRTKPFSSFFPGIAGLMGIPLWSFYVNRGQGVCSFGVENKDSSIMEFQPANKAYRLASTHGFRTFIKYKKDDVVGFYEPFQDNQANHKYNLQNKLTISPYDLVIEEENLTLGLKVNIKYFTIPQEPIAALARIVTITNISDNDLDLEIMDGMPIIIPFGIPNKALKEMNRTIEAWTYVENMKSSAPFYRVKVLTKDSSEITPESKGNFYFSFYYEDEKTVNMDPVIDPLLIFGQNSDLSFPYEFVDNGFNPKQRQHFENRTPSAMGHTKVTLKSSEDKEFYSLVGHAGNIDVLNSLLKKFRKKDFFTKKELENEKLIKTIMDTSFINSDLEAFNSYSRQNFLDNVLRGGFPITLKYKNKKDVFYVYSRKHGDLERDYNDFLLMPSYFSQGNGNFRDINQNRRNDVWINTDVGFSNIEYFVNLIQLDGFNPLVVKGLTYLYKNNRDNNYLIMNTMSEEQGQKLIKFLKEPFLPDDLIKFVNKEDIKLKISMFEFISLVITSSSKVECAEHKEGYWVDHWFYNSDLIESYSAIYPDKMENLIFYDKRFSFYDDEYFVVPRIEKYVLHNGNPRQYESVRFDSKKKSMINSRAYEKNKVRTEYGMGRIYLTTLFVKLIILSLNKISSLDSSGIGVEMESDKPGWNDAMNGLPGLFGSSTSETFELKRLMTMLTEWLTKYKLKISYITLPVEAADFIKSVLKILKGNLKGKISDFECWDKCTAYKEEYREKVRFGIHGLEKDLDIEVIKKYLEVGLLKLKNGIKKAYNKETKIYDAYYMNIAKNYNIISGDSVSNGERKKVRVTEFEQVALAPFLEAQMHALLIEKNIEKAKKLYNSVRKNEIYDKQLGMYKVNGSLENYPMEIGRARVFTPGWLENESVFMHMHYKYLLSMLKSNLVDEFFNNIKETIVPFMKPEIYGRSIYENSSFIVSSVNPDERLHGTGFVARLSGSTAEFYHMLLVMSFGLKPFRVNELGGLELKFKPLLPGWIFTKDAIDKVFYSKDGIKDMCLEKNTFSINFLGNTIVVYHNENRKNTYGDDSAVVKKIKLEDFSGNVTNIDDNLIKEPYASGIRDGKFSRIDIWLK